MTDRYAVRRTDNGYGVWDAAVNGWHGERNLEMSDATRVADKMNACAGGPAVPLTGNGADGSPRESRPVDPPKRVLVKLEDGWSSGRLDRWTRQLDGWYGRVRLDLGGPATWYPASNLRPAAAGPA